jgi:hypothetical protein
MRRASAARAGDASRSDRAARAIRFRSIRRASHSARRAGPRACAHAIAPLARGLPTASRRPSPIDDHRPIGARQHAARDASQQQPLQSSPAVRPHEDRIARRRDGGVRARGRWRLARQGPRARAARALCRTARAAGYRALCGHILSFNRGMLDLAARLGFVEEYRQTGEVTVVRQL